MTDPSSSTRDTLLDAAEVLFAEQGISGASLRAITKKADANLAAVHYHFGSKDALVRAVFARRLEPVNHERLRLLDALEQERQAPSVEAILHAMIWPVMAMGGAQTSDFKRLMGRLYSEPGPEMRNLLREQFRGVVDRFTAALRRACPTLGDEEIFLRFHFVIGAMVQLALNAPMIHEHSGGRVDPGDARRMTERLVAFAAGGFSAPAVESTEET